MFPVSSRRIWLVVALLVVLAGTSVVPASAWNGEADEPSIYSACVELALDDAGFDDLRRQSAATRQAIDCLAHYGITRGTGSGAFSPEGPVPRMHMALFLVRAAGPAGIDLPRPSDRPARQFTDLEGLSIEIREAIDQLVQVGITSGKTRSTFGSQAPVTRRQLAVFLYRFLDLAPVGPGGTNSMMPSPTTPTSKTWGSFRSGCTTWCGPCSRWAWWKARPAPPSVPTSR